MLVDAFEFLPDGQALVARLKGDLGQQRELAPCGAEERRSGLPLSCLNVRNLAGKPLGLLQPRL